MTRTMSRSSTKLYQEGGQAVTGDPVRRET